MRIISHILITLSILTIQITLAEGSSGVIINELELNPPEGENQWIELYNQGNSSVSLTTLELLSVDGEIIKKRFVIPFSKENILHPDKYYVIQIGEQPGNFFDNTLTTIVLSDGQTTLDIAQGLSDELADDKTWQRFPDRIDTGAFEDWTFRTATKRVNNGNIGQIVAECALNPFCWGKLDVFFHKIHTVKIGDNQFLIGTFYDSTKLDVDLIPEEKKIKVTKSSTGLPELGVSPTFIHVIIPRDLLSGSYSVLADGAQVPFYQITNETHSRLIIKDLTQEKLIEITGTVIVPEFPLGTIMPIGVAIFLVILTQWRYNKNQIHQI